MSRCRLGIALVGGAVNFHLVDRNVFVEFEVRFLYEKANAGSGYRRRKGDGEHRMHFALVLADDEVFLFGQPHIINQDGTSMIAPSEFFTFGGKAMPSA